MATTGTPPSQRSPTGPPSGRPVAYLPARGDVPLRATVRTLGAPPPVPSLAVRRPGLEQVLDDHDDRPVVLVRGPAGAGKTLLVCQWLEAQRDQCVWLVIDPSYDDPELLLRHLIEAVVQLAPEAGGPVAASLAGATADDGDLREALGLVAHRFGSTVSVVLDGSIGSVTSGAANSSRGSSSIRPRPSASC